MTFSVLKILDNLLSMQNSLTAHCTKNEVSIKDFFSKCDQIRSKLWIWSYLLKKSSMEDLIFLCSWDVIKSGVELQTRSEDYSHFL